MATKKTTTKPESTTSTKTTKNPVTTPIVVDNQPAQPNERQSQFATILIGLLIIAGGLLIYNYFQSANVPATTSEQTSNISPTPAVTAAPTQAPTPAVTTKATPVFTPTPAPTKTPATAAPTSQGSTNTSYTVLAGDSTWSIAEKVYGDGFQYNKIVQANHLGNDASGRPVVEIGQVLTIPGGSSPTTSQPAIGGPAPATTHVAASTHLIQHGETLWSIAETTYGQGSNWILIFNDPRNHLSLNANGKPLIHAGNILYLPAAP